MSGWGFPLGEQGSVSMIVRLHYADGQTEDHPLRNGEHLADYIRRVDVPGSKFAFDLRGRQVRYLAITPARSETIAAIELVKDRQTKESFPASVMAELGKSLRQNGLFTFIMSNAMGSIVFIVPPLCITKEQLDEGLKIIETNLANTTDRIVE